MSELKKLESQLEKNHKERSRLNDEIDKIKTQEQLPTLKEKYEGKYWKYENSYGGEDGDKWWLYAYCKKAVGIDDALYNIFQLAPHENTFKVNETASFFYCQVEITKKEYQEALKNFKKEVNKL